MTDILCKWLNDELKLSNQTDPATLARDFCTGFLVGEVLSKYQLQDDFDQFSQNKTADSKLNNFTRLEPTLHLLGIPFDTNIARDIMTEKQGVATRLLYQLFIALNNKTKAGLTGVAMETMRPAAPVKLEAIESGIYKERLKHLTPRQTDLNLEALVDRFHKKQIEMEQTAFKDRFLEQERIREWQQDQRRQLLERSKQAKAKQSEVMAKIQAATVHIPKPPPSKTAEAISLRLQKNKQKEAQATQNAIAGFEERMKMTLPPTKPFGSEDASMTQAEEDKEEEAPEETLNMIKPQSNSEYINKIRKRLQEDASARQEREKRRRKVLVDQLKAHEAQEEAHREEMLVNRLMRQSQQERRIAVQLLQARHEKEVIRKNRLTRESQYQDRRLKDFEDALNREAEMARLAKLEYIEQTRADRELHDKIMAERAEARYRKHYEMCSEVLSQVIDFSTKIGEYRELTNRLLPNKLMREWTSLFLNGKPLYEVKAVQDPTSLEPTPEQVLEEERLTLLDEGDFMEYKNMIGEWAPPEGSEISGPPRNNPIVGHIIQRLFNMVHPPSPPPPPPEFPPFPVKACVLGKVFSGKTTVIEKLATAHRLRVLNVDSLVTEAIEANKNGELVEVKAVEEPVETKPGQEAPSKETAAQQPVAEGTPAPEAVDSNKQEENPVTPQTVDDEKKDEGNEKGFLTLANVAEGTNFSRFTKLNANEEPMIAIGIQQTDTKGACALRCHLDTRCHVISVGAATGLGVSCGMYEKFREVLNPALPTNNDNEYFAKVYSDCIEVLGHHGLTKVSPTDWRGSPQTMYCTNGWTYIQRRLGPATNFSRTWAEYREGFGDVAGGHWLGNEIVHVMTWGKNYRLKLRLDSNVGGTFWSQFGNFSLANENLNYTLNLDANDASGVGVQDHSLVSLVGKSFSTWDRDNDDDPGENCAELSEGGWWYGSCGQALLTATHPDDPRCGLQPQQCFKYAGITGNDCDAGCLLTGSAMMIKAQLPGS